MSALRFECRALRRDYATRNGTVAALHDITFRAEPGEFISIVGPSGCGKTTLLKILAGLLAPTSGSLVFLDRDAGAPAPRNGLVFQEHGVFPWMSVVENVAFGLEMEGVPKRERLERGRDFLDRIGLGAFAHHHPHELSVGMRQRVGIARAFLADVELLLMDEPFGALDAQTKVVLQQELLRIWRERQRLVVYVTHDIEEAILLSDRVLVMSGRPGRILEDIRIPLPRPRDIVAWRNTDVNEIRWHIWQRLEDEVRRGLSVAR